MDANGLRQVLGEIGIGQADLARLIGVTTRAVALWIAGERPVPGPVEGYLRLLGQASPSVRQSELNRLKGRISGMRDGVFGIRFRGNFGAGTGVLIFENGRVFGADEARVKYDGHYTFDEATGLANATIKVTYPPNVMAVQGISNPYEWSIDVTASFDPRRDAGTVPVRTSLGKPLNAEYFFLRGLPEAA